MSELCVRQSEVDRLSRQEGSAGLANHALACQRIGEGLRRLRAEHQELIVLFIDLGLQPGNDGDDLACGDALQEIMGRLAAVIRATDTVTAMGGGRIVLTAETGSSGLPSPADILRDRCGRVFARPLRGREKRFTVRARVGAAVAVAGVAATAERLLAQAEAAMLADEAP